MDDSKKDVEERNDDYNKGRSIAMGIAAVVYVGVVVAVTIIFLSFVLGAFPENAYLSRAVMTIAGMLVGCSAISFPFALHLWAVEKIHRRVTIVLYFVEMFVIAVNSIISFTALLQKNAGLTTAPAWVLLYEPFSIVAIIYTLFAWGTVFLLDPAHKRKAKDLANQQKFEDKISQRMAEFLDSQDGEDVIMEIATRRAMDEFSPDRFEAGKKRWGTGNKKALPENTPAQLPDGGYETMSPEVLEQVVRQLAEQNNLYPVESGKNGKGGAPGFLNRQR
jgi:hypothetical protein